MGRNMSQEESECAYPGCKRKHLESSKERYCILHAGAEDKGEQEFKKALESYISEIKAKDLDYNFRGFIFVGDTNFRKYFGLTIFKDVYFEAAEFGGDVHFEGIKFQEDAYLREAEFCKDAGFQGAEFLGEAHFERVDFHGAVFFLRAKFQKAATFVDVGFYEPAFFNGAEFQGRTWISPKLIKKSISFVLANLENVSLTPLDFDKNACIYFTRARLRNTEIRRKDIESHIAQEKQKKLSEAKEVYLLLKNNFHSLGRYDDESWAFRKEKEMERKSYFHRRSFLKWLGSMFLNILYGYGEKPLRVIRSVLIEIVVFAFLFMILGIRTAGNVALRHNILGLKSLPWRDLLDCLYFSTVTFTTLGYGDFRPLEGWSRLIAGVEAFTGAFMMALFVYTFARRTGGR